MRHPIAAMLAAAAAVAMLAVPATAETSVVTASVGTSVSISTPPSAAVNFGTLALGVNTAGSGTIAVAANTAYTVTVVADKAALTAWDGTAYGTDTLTTPLTLVPTLATGAPAVTAVAAVGTTAQTVMTGTGLTTDSATLQLEQTVLSTDKPGNYRTVLTYTAAPAV